LTLIVTHNILLIICTSVHRWSTADGKTFKDDLEATGIPLPEGWEETATWSIMSGKFDPDGWQYATALDSACWYPQNNNSLCKSRRSSPALHCIHRRFFYCIHRCWDFP
jgi:hypothetical protein